MGVVEGKVAIVTGGASGIGAATAERLAQEGAAVVVADINSAGAEEVASKIRANSGRAVAQATDVSEEAAVAAMVARAVEEWGRLDILHNNAALLAPDHLAADRMVTEMSVAVWDRTMAVNLRGPMLGCKHAIPAMLADGGGSIVNGSSGSALLGDYERTAYAASKAGLDALTRYVAVQYGKQGIRCNAVLPGLVLTPGPRAVLDQASLGLLRESILVPELAEPEDLADVVTFLASDQARHVTGQLLSVDGGMFARSVPAGIGAFLRSTGAPPPPAGV